MKIRILSIACVTTAAALLAACTAVYKNTDACEQLMRSKLAETSPDALKISHAGAGIRGSRVVVEGSIEHVVAAASGASAANAANAASAPRAASSAAATYGASNAADASGASNVSAASGASSASSVSTTAALSLKSSKPKKTVTPAAAECTFNGPTLSVFSWLAPASLATPAATTTE